MQYPIIEALACGAGLLDLAGNFCFFFFDMAETRRPTWAGLAGCLTDAPSSAPGYSPMLAGVFPGIYRGKYINRMHQLDWKGWRGLFVRW